MKLSQMHLASPNCRQALFVEADLRFADLYQADLRGADFSGANLTEAKLAGADLSAIRFNEKTQFHGAKLSGAHLDDPFRAFAEQAGGCSGRIKTHLSRNESAQSWQRLFVCSRKTMNRDAWTP